MHDVRYVAHSGVTRDDREHDLVGPWLMEFDLPVEEKADVDAIVFFFISSEYVQYGLDVAEMHDMVWLICKLLFGHFDIANWNRFVNPTTTGMVACGCQTQAFVVYIETADGTTRFVSLGDLEQAFFVHGDHFFFCQVTDALFFFQKTI